MQRQFRTKRFHIFQTVRDQLKSGMNGGRPPLWFECMRLHPSYVPLKGNRPPAIVFKDDEVLENRRYEQAEFQAQIRQLRKHMHDLKKDADQSVNAAVRKKLKQRYAAIVRLAALGSGKLNEHFGVTVTDETVRSFDPNYERNLLERYRQQENEATIDVEKLSEDELMDAVKAAPSIDHQMAQLVARFMREKGMSEHEAYIKAKLTVRVLNARRDRERIAAQRVSWKRSITADSIARHRHPHAVRKFIRQHPLKPEHLNQYRERLYQLQDEKIATEHARFLQRLESAPGSTDSAVDSDHVFVEQLEHELDELERVSEARATIVAPAISATRRAAIRAAKERLMYISEKRKVKAERLKRKEAREQSKTKRGRK